MPNKSEKIKFKFWIYVDLQEDSLYTLYIIGLHSWGDQGLRSVFNLQWVHSGERERCYIPKIKHASIVFYMPLTAD